MKVSFTEAKVDYTVIDTSIDRRGVVHSLVGPRSGGVTRPHRIRVQWSNGAYEDFEWEFPKNIEVHSFI